MNYLHRCKIQLQYQEITLKKKTSWQRQLKTVLVCVAQSEKGFNSTRRHLDTFYLCRFISVQEEMRAFTELIPPHNWLQELLSLSKTTVACCKCCWSRLVLVLLLEKVVVIMQASILYKHVQSSRTSEAFSATKGITPIQSCKNIINMGQPCARPACSYAS